MNEIIWKFTENQNISLIVQIDGGAKRITYLSYSYSVYIFLRKYSIYNKSIYIMCTYIKYSHLVKKLFIIFLFCLVLLVLLSQYNIQYHNFTLVFLRYSFSSRILGAFTLLKRVAYRKQFIFGI